MIVDDEDAYLDQLNENQEKKIHHLKQLGIYPVDTTKPSPPLCTACNGENTLHMALCEKCWSRLTDVIKREIELEKER